MSPAQVAAIAIGCFVLGLIAGLLLGGMCQSAKQSEDETGDPVRIKIKSRPLWIECPRCGSGLFGGRSHRHFFALCEHEECGFCRMASTTGGLMQEIAEARS